jgi:hypothetical protein
MPRPARPGDENAYSVPPGPRCVLPPVARHPVYTLCRAPHSHSAPCRHSGLRELFLPVLDNRSRWPLRDVSTDSPQYRTLISVAVLLPVTCINWTEGRGIPTPGTTGWEPALTSSSRSTGSSSSFTTWCTSPRTRSVPVTTRLPMTLRGWTITALGVPLVSYASHEGHLAGHDRSCHQLADPSRGSVPPGLRGR